MKKRFIAVIMSLVMCASLVLPVGYADVKADVMYLTQEILSVCLPLMIMCR